MKKVTGLRLEIYLSPNYARLKKLAITDSRTGRETITESRGSKDKTGVPWAQAAIGMCLFLLQYKRSKNEDEHTYELSCAKGSGALLSFAREISKKSWLNRIFEGLGPFSVQQLRRGKKDEHWRIAINKCLLPQANVKFLSENGRRLTMEELDALEMNLSPESSAATVPGKSQPQALSPDAPILIATERINEPLLQRLQRSHYVFLSHPYIPAPTFEHFKSESCPKLKLFQPIIEQLSEHKSCFVYGPRGSGKTTLALQVAFTRPFSEKQPYYANIAETCFPPDNLTLLKKRLIDVSEKNVLVIFDNAQFRHAITMEIMSFIKQHTLQLTSIFLSRTDVPPHGDNCLYLTPTSDEIISIMQYFVAESTRKEAVAFLKKANARFRKNLFLLTLFFKSQSELGQKSRGLYEHIWKQLDFHPALFMSKPEQRDLLSAASFAAHGISIADEQIKSENIAKLISSKLMDYSCNGNVMSRPERYYAFRHSSLAQVLFALDSYCTLHAVHDLLGYHCRYLELLRSIRMHYSWHHHKSIYEFITKEVD